MRILTVLRIMRMEYRYDTLRQHSPAQIRTTPRLGRMFRALTAYCDGGQWLKDYVLDEQGALPRWLKRGVLSQDGLYNLLCDLNDTENNP